MSLCRALALLAPAFFPFRVFRRLHFREWRRLVKTSSIFTPLAKGCSQRGFPVPSARRKACLRSQRACRFGERSKTVLPQRERRRRERKRRGKVREERRAFRRRIIRILLFDDENLFLSFVTASRYNAESVFGRKYTMAMGGRKRQAKMARSSLEPEMKRLPFKNHSKILLPPAPPFVHFV